MKQFAIVFMLECEDATAERVQKILWDAEDDLSNKLWAPEPEGLPGNLGKVTLAYVRETTAGRPSTERSTPGELYMGALKESIRKDLECSCGSKK